MRPSIALVRIAALACVTMLGACAGPHPVAHIPVSGINGNVGGSEETIYYDREGRPHFQS